MGISSLNLDPRNHIIRLNAPSVDATRFVPTCAHDTMPHFPLEWFSLVYSKPVIIDTIIINDEMHKHNRREKVIDIGI